MRFHKEAGPLAVAALAAVLPSCGGGSSTPSTPTTPQTTVVAQGSGTLQVDFIGAVNFSTPAAGRLEVTVDWTFASNDIDIAVFAGSCTATQIINLACGAPAAFSDSLNKPERLSIASAAAGAYTLGIENLGPGNESLSYQVTLTR
jgi:hypothetical protein